MNKRLFLVLFVMAVLDAATLFSQTIEEARHILQQQAMALQGESEQPIKCGFSAMALLLAEPPIDPDLQLLLKSAFQRPQLPLSYVTPGGRFKFHYKLTGIDAVDPTSTIMPNVPDYVYEAGLAAERAYHLLVDTLGFAPHASDDSTDGPELDFYFQDDNAYGLTVPEFSAGQSRGPAYIIVENDFDGFYTTGLNALRVTVAHEYFHAVQLNIRAPNQDLFFFEMTSVWFEDVAYDEVNDYIAYVLDRRREPLGFFQTLDLPLDLVNYWHEYGSGLWLHFLTKKLDKNRLDFRNNFVYRAWQRLPLEPAMNGMKTVLEAPEPYRVLFADALREFYEWTFFTGGRADTVQYFDEGQLYPSIDFQQKTIATANQTIAGSLQPLAAQFYRMIRAGQNTQFTLLTTEPNRWRVFAISFDIQNEYAFQRGSGQTPIFVTAPPGEDTVVVAAVNTSLTDCSEPSGFCEYDLKVELLAQRELANALGKPWPNPFLHPGQGIACGNGLMCIPFQIRERADVDALVIKEDGRVVKKFKFGTLPANFYEDKLKWDGRDESGNVVASGVYLVLFMAGGFNEMTKIVVVN
jgi:hypothetical protein